MKTSRIVTQHDIMLGKPVIHGTRITVELVLRKMAQGASLADLLEMYPHLTAEDVRACFDYAADLVASKPVSKIQSLAGAYRGKLSNSEEFIQRKEEEKCSENSG